MVKTISNQNFCLHLLYVPRRQVRLVVLRAVTSSTFDQRDEAKTRRLELTLHISGPRLTTLCTY